MWYPTHPRADALIVRRSSADGARRRSVFVTDLSRDVVARESAQLHGVLRTALVDALGVVAR